MEEEQFGNGATPLVVVGELKRLLVSPFFWGRIKDASSRSECLEARFHLELKRVSSEVNEAGRWLVAGGSTCSVGKK